MSPLSIPGTTIQIPYPPGKSKCKNKDCGRDYDRPKVKRDGNFVTLQCPYCKHVFKTMSYRVLVAKSKKK